MSAIKPYDDAYYSMTWMGPKGYPENGNSGRCYFTGLLGMFCLHGESDVLFAEYFLAAQEAKIPLVG